MASGAMRVAFAGLRPLEDGRSIQHGEGGGSGIDVRSARDVAPVIEHAGTVPVWWLIQPGELKDATRGGFLELVSEWEVAGGGLVDPHSHPTHEFYYIIAGRGIMKIADEEREVGQGDQ